jgi:hypothetical protein
LTMNRLLTPSDIGACFAMGAILAACASQHQNPACAPERLAEIESAYVLEVLDACDGQQLETCAAWPDIRERYDAMREGWVQCR